MSSVPLVDSSKAEGPVSAVVHSSKGPVSAVYKLHCIGKLQNEFRKVGSTLLLL